MSNSYSAFQVKPILVGLLLSATLPVVHAQSFAPAVSYSTGTRSYPTDVKVGDINGDGYPDLLTANSLEGSVGVLLNKKNGTFSPITSYPTNEPGGYSGPRTLALGDIDKDGDLDVVFADLQVEAIGVLLNKGNGTFASVAHYNTGTMPNSQTYDVSLGDVDGDGYLDAVANNLRADQVVVLLNKRNGTFGPLTAYSTVSAGLYADPFVLALGDVNNDGYPDIATTTLYGQVSCVQLNKKDGTFAPVVHYPQSADSKHLNIKLADINSDGFLDLVTLSYTFGYVEVRLNKKDGTFGASTAYPAQDVKNTPIGLAVGDLNGDGAPDIVTGDCISWSTGPVMNNVSVLLNKKNGAFASGVVFPIGMGAAPSRITLADVNLDGKLDIITSNSSSPGYSVSVLLNQTTILAAKTPVASSQAQVSAYPNPAVAGSQVLLAAPNLPAAARRLEVLLFDAVGRVAKRSTLAVSQGEGNAQLPTANLAPGLYRLQATAYDAQGGELVTLTAQALSLQ